MGERLQLYAAGDVAEWLGRGLQSLVQGFDSPRRLQPFPGRPRGDASAVTGTSRRDDEASGKLVGWLYPMAPPTLLVPTRPG